VDIYLIRHGQSYVNLPNYNHYDWDQPLTELGELQAVAAAQWIAENIEASMLFSSTLMRTQQTAEAISATTRLTIEFDHRIREIGCNAPDGSPLKPTEETRYIEGVWGSLQPYDPVTGGGENWMQFRARVGAFIESLLRRFDNHTTRSRKKRIAQTAIVACHGGVIETFFEYVFEKGPWSVASVMTENTGITHLQYRPVPHRPEWLLHYHNRTEHLTPDLFSHR
jgi:broad specificity phosphatase PhoE